MARRFGESMKLDWYFAWPLVLMRTVTPSATRSTLIDVTCTATLGVSAVPMPAATTASRNSNPRLGTKAFIGRAPLSRLWIGMSFEDQAQGHGRGALPRLRRDRKGHGGPGDTGHPPVAEGVAAFENVPDTVGPFDESQRALAALHDAHQFGRSDVDALGFAYERDRRKRVAAILAVVGHGRERLARARIERAHRGCSRSAGRRWGYRRGRRHGGLGRRGRRLS